MKRNIRTEIVTSMDNLHFSQSRKDAMVHNLMTAQNRSANPISRRRLVFLAAAAVMLVAMLTGAAVFTRWSDTANAHYGASQDDREYAESIGLSAEPQELVSATDQGITVTAMQTIVDPYRAKLIFKIEGFEVPDGAAPSLTGGVKSIGGQPNGYLDMQVGSFYTGIMTDEAGNHVYTDGTPIQLDSQGNLLFRYADTDGSLEYEIDLHFEEPGAHLGKEIEVHFSGFGTSNGNASDEISVEGDWTLIWELTGTENTIHATPDQQIGTTGHRVLEAEVTPITLRTVIQTADYFSGWETLEYFSPSLAGVQLKDGTVKLCTTPSEEGYQDMDKLLYEIEVCTDTIIDVEQVSGLVFLENGTQHIIPIA